MAHTAALFQLGMDLDGDSSTAQTEDTTFACGAITARTDRKDYFVERDGRRYAGTHLIVDLVDAHRLDDMAHVERALTEAVAAAEATLLHIHLHRFTPNGGISGVAVLAESHISIHSWPERGYAALDIFMCGAANPYAAVEVLKRAFRPAHALVTEHLRGEGL